MLPANSIKYLKSAMAGTPDILDYLLKEVAEDSPVWDLRPDPERFTIREVLAHLADWEDVFLDRLIRTRDQHEPTLQGYDEGQFAIDRDYAHQSPYANLKRFREGRARMLEFFNGLSAEQWGRVGLHTEVGQISLEAHAALIAGHDGYHTHQIVQYLQTGG